jgi:flagellar biosynthesis/type III secretory pathway M-ring protein FliF/YscJ
MIIIDLHQLAMIAVGFLVLWFLINFCEAISQERKDKERREAEQLREMEKERLREMQRAEQKIGWRKGERPSERRDDLSRRGWKRFPSRVERGQFGEQRLQSSQSVSKTARATRRSSLW